MARFTRQGTINKVREELTGSKARVRFAARCGYPGQPQALMQRLHARLQEILPLFTSPSQLALFGKIFDGRKLMEDTRQEALNFPSGEAGPAELWPWQSGQAGLRLARAARLTGEGEFSRGFARWLDALLAALRNPTGPSWQDNRMMSTRALNLLFSLRFTDNPHKLPPDTCVDVILHLYLAGQILEQELNDNPETQPEQAQAAGALLFLGSSLDFLPEAEHWLKLGTERLGPALLAHGNGRALYSIGQLDCALMWGCLGLWMGRRQQLVMPELIAAIHKLAGWLRSLSPPWLKHSHAADQHWGPLNFSSQNAGEVANLAALLMTDPALRGPRQTSELLFWLLGPDVEENLRKLAGGRAPGAVDLPSAGLSGLCANWRRRALGIWLTTGPRAGQSQNHAPINHSLSLFIFRQGHPLLQTPIPASRGSLANYLKSRQATNAVVIDNHPPVGGLVEVEGLEHNAAHLFMAASYSGYQHLADPVLIRRRVFMDNSAGVIHIVDQIQGKQQHLCSLYFHFPPQAIVSKAPRGGFIIELDGEQWWFKSDVKAQVSLVRGQVEPPLGWALAGANSMLPSPTILMQAQIVGSARLNNSLALLPAAK